MKTEEVVLKEEIGLDEMIGQEVKEEEKFSQSSEVNLGSSLVKESFVSTRHEALNLGKRRYGQPTSMIDIVKELRESG